MKKEDKIIKIVKDILKDLLSRLGVKSESEIKISEEVIFVNIKTGDPGFLIGWHGNTLSALEHILRLLVARKTQQEDFIPLVLDVENYKQKQKESLEQLTVAQAMQVRQTGELIEFSPMPSYKRRIIHLALANFDDITTESIGEGVERRVVIKPVAAETQKGAKAQKQEKTATALNQKIGSGQTKMQKDKKPAAIPKTQKSHKDVKTATAKATKKTAKMQKKKSKK